MIQTGTTDIPDISEEWYRDVVDVADSAPAPVQWFAVHFTEGVILLLGLMLMAVALFRLAAPTRGTGPSRWSRRRRRPGVRVQRGAQDTGGRGPPVPGVRPPSSPGSARRWATGRSRATTPPSPAALAHHGLLLSRRWGLLARRWPLLAAFSRVFVGVHYPHDVVAGVLLGVPATLLVTPLAARVLAETLRRRSATALREPVPTAPGPRH